MNNDINKNGMKAGISDEYGQEIIELPRVVLQDNIENIVPYDSFSLLAGPSHVSRYRETLMPVCLAMLKFNRADADDAVGQAMVAFASQTEDQLDRIGNKTAWLRRVARNACISLLRRKQIAARFISPIKIDEVTAAEAAGRRLGAPQVESAEEALMRRQLRAVITAGIRSMPRRQRQAFERRFLHDQSYGEISLALGTTEANARKLIQKGREFLRRYIQQNYE